MIPPRKPLQYLRSLRHDRAERLLFIGQVFAYAAAAWAVAAIYRPGVAAIVGVGTSAVLAYYFVSRAKNAALVNTPCTCINCTRRYLSLLRQNQQNRQNNGT